MKLRDLAKETKELRVIYRTSSGDFVVNLFYRPQVITIGFLDELKSLNSTDRLVYQVEKLVESWDLQDDEDKIIPVSHEAIVENHIPIYLLSSIIDAVTKDRMLFSAESKKG